jgi:hypothetical protein
LTKPDCDKKLLWHLMFPLELVVELLDADYLYNATFFLFLYL